MILRDHESSKRVRGRLPSRLTGIAITALTCALAATAGLLTGGGATHTEVTWPAAGIALVCVFLLGSSALFGVAAAAAAVALGFGYGPIAALLIALAVSLQAAIAVRTLRWTSFDPKFSRLREALVYASVTLAVPVVSAVLAIPAWAIDGRAPAEFGALVLEWWLGNALGMLAIAPAIFAWHAKGVSVARAEITRALVFLGLVALTCLVVFTGALPPFFGESAAVYLVLPFAIWTALACGFRSTTSSTLIVVGAVLWASQREVGLGFTGDAVTSAHVLYAFAIICAITSLVVYSLVEERRDIAQRLRANVERFRALTSLSADWFWETDSEHRFTEVSGQAVEEGKVNSANMMGSRPWELPNIEVSREEMERHDRAIANRQPFRNVEMRRSLSKHEPRIISVSGDPMFDNQGVFTGYRGIASDITSRRKAEQTTREAKQFLDALIDAIPSPIAVKDAQHRFVTANAAFCKFYGRTLEEIQGHPDFEFLPETGSPQVHTSDREVIEKGGTVEFERAFKVNGVTRWMSVRKSRLQAPDGSRLVVVLMNEVTERKRVEEALKMSERRFRDFAAAASDVVWESDKNGRYTYVSPQVQKLLGYSADEIIGHSASRFMSPAEADRVREWLAQNTADDKSFRGLEQQLITKTGDTVWVEVSGIPTFNKEGEFIGHRGAARDITDRRKAEDRISYLATRDALTGLPNRVLFNDRLNQGLLSARRKRESLAVMFIDLDRFKHINDSLGHHIGDLLLKEVATRMQSCIRKGDTLSRMGGDEFVVTLEGLQHAEDARQVADKILSAMASPFHVSHHTLTTSCSIGISVFPQDGEDAETLMKNADTAMYHAKEKGRRNYQFFSREMNVKAVERHTLETSLRRALDQDQFTIYYQPQIDIESGRVAGVEALLRWKHPERGMLSPTAFVGVAEESGLIEPIGQWLIRNAIAQNKTWHEAGLPALRVGINVSARQFSRPKEFTRFVTHTLSNVGLEPNFVELEMTETTLWQNADENVQSLRRLGKLGLRIAVDDFGTGYSSLSYLKQLPIHTLKIDRTFVRDLEEDKDSEVLVNTIIAMAHSLNLRVTAEGVENLGQLSALKRYGCDEYQGYLFSKPVSAREFAMRFVAPQELNFGS